MRLSQLIASLPSLHTRVDANPEVKLISADSRRVEAGTLFVAYDGVSVDGHRFIDDAIVRGAVAIVGEKPRAASSKVPYLQVRSGREALAYLHAAWNDFPARKLTMIGVTGTDGKTTTSALIHSILRTAGVKVGMVGTLNALIADEAIDVGLHTTTPDADELQRLLRRMVDAGLTHCVLEVTSHGLQQHRVDACDFDVAVVTNITHEHLDMHGSYEAYRAAKAKLFESLSDSVDKGTSKIAILNRDDSSYAYLHERVEGQSLAYGMHDETDFSAQDIAYTSQATRFVVDGNQIETALVGEYNIYNCLAAYAATVGALGLEPEVARAGIAALRGVSGRMERIDAGQDFIAIVDFAHTPNGLEQAIAAARTMTDGQVIIVFGSAGLRDREKRRLMGKVAAQSADRVVITAEDPRTESLDEIMDASAQAMIAQGRVEGVDFWRVADRGAALAFACSLAGAGDVVMACGKGHEQSMCFGEIEYAWDERDAMRAALAGEPLRTLPTAGMTD